MHLAVRAARWRLAVTRGVLATRGVNVSCTRESCESKEVGARGGVSGVNANSVAERDVYALSDTVCWPVCFPARVGGLRLVGRRAGCRT